jgi:uroporphyrinogen-III synthase
VPSIDSSATALLEEWTEMAAGSPRRRVLTLRSEIAKPTLTDGLIARGHDVRSVVAYRTVGVPVSDRIREDVASGRVRAILVTSGSVAEQVHQQLGDVPDGVLIACIGPRTAKDARRSGVRVDVVASERSAASLIQSLVEIARHEEPRPDTAGLTGLADLLDRSTTE